MLSGDRHEKARWADRILRIATNDTQISHHLASSGATTSAPVFSMTQHLVARRDGSGPLKSGYGRAESSYRKTGAARAP